MAADSSAYPYAQLYVCSLYSPNSRQTTRDQLIYVYSSYAIINVSKYKSNLAIHYMPCQLTGCKIESLSMWTDETAGD